VSVFSALAQNDSGPFVFGSTVHTEFVSVRFRRSAVASDSVINASDSLCSNAGCYGKFSRFSDVPSPVGSKNRLLECYPSETLEGEHRSKFSEIFNNSAGAPLPRKA
jgi:hypothetical protein